MKIPKSKQYQIKFKIGKRIISVPQKRFTILVGEFNDSDSFIIEQTSHMIYNIEKNYLPIHQLEVIYDAIRLGNDSNFPTIITTTSPYVLSQLNNFIFANDEKYKLTKKLKSKFKGVLIPYNDIVAYMVGDKEDTITNMMDEEYRGIDVSLLDKASRIINKEFDQIIDCKNRGKK